MTSGCVTVTGPPALICSLNSGTTEPDEASTLPNRTMQNRVLLPRRCKPCNTISANRLVAPMTLVGLTALSVDTNTKVSTSASCAASAAYQVEITLL